MIPHLLEQKRGGVIVRIIFWTSFLVVLGALFFPISFGGRHGRSYSSRAKADLRSLATAIEAYYVDNNYYPAWSELPALNAFGTIKDMPKLANGVRIPTFRIKQSDSDTLMTLTTPVSYITSYFQDSFGKPRPNSYAYWRNEIAEQRSEGDIPPKEGWIAWSMGPDGDYDLTLENVRLAYDPNESVPNDYLLDCCTYDPTNGSTSNGDIYRTKQ